MHETIDTAALAKRASERFEQSADASFIDDQMVIVLFSAREWRALAALLRGMVWQPIETAPKDGTRMLLASRGRQCRGSPEWSITIGCWLAEFEAEHWDYTHSGPVYRGAWTDFTVASWGYQEFTELSPTHWMPLPAPPLSTTKEG